MDPYKKVILTVSQINQFTKMLFDSNELLSDVYVKGEISNFVNHRTGHFYFSLKDENSAIKAVMFRTSASKLAFLPENGMKVIVRGRVSVFERDGVYQVYAEDIQPDGIGSLYYAYEQLKRKLESEGLFAEIHKKPIPKVPLRVGIITSPTGAAIRDITNIIGRRFPLAEMVLYPTLVQGDRAAVQLRVAVEYFNASRSVDVIILGRGGGSIEDLWAFNDEALARAVFASDIPVISAVGHESDFTICDFVSDVRASTPSAAAEIAVPEVTDVGEKLESLQKRMTLLMQGKVLEKKKILTVLSSSPTLKSPKNFLDTKRIITSRMLDRLDAAVSKIKDKKTAYYKEKAASLGALSPLAVLSRGYGVSYTEDGKILKTVKNVSVGDSIKSEFSDGIVYSTVTKTELKGDIKDGR
ncbi:MAG: exodeoxyribonuclease VII large subunit [Clostridia bacterium]|nr:exodeoxyribonuclease VII large subunit [Clostridia bacterium]